VRRHSNLSNLQLHMRVYTWNTMQVLPVNTARGLACHKFLLPTRGKNIPWLEDATQCRGISQLGSCDAREGCAAVGNFEELPMNKNLLLIGNHLNSSNAQYETWRRSLFTEKCELQARIQKMPVEGDDPVRKNKTSGVWGPL
jgi:hypothetical protein